MPSVKAVRPALTMLCSRPTDLENTRECMCRVEVLRSTGTHSCIFM